LALQDRNKGLKIANIMQVMYCITSLVVEFGEANARVEEC
jgi:hypothetical protein